jgi:Amt family ammonium transporter
MTTNTAAIAAVITSTAVSWKFIGKPDLGMTINGCLAGLVAITGACAYVSVLSSLIIGAIAGIVVVFSVIFFDKKKIDDPVGATSVHLVCGVLGTIFVGLFAEEGITSLSTVNGLFFGGGFAQLGKQLLGIATVGGFVFLASLAVWYCIKKTMGMRVTLQEEIEGLDIGEHGNSAYPDFMAAVPELDYDDSDGGKVLPLPTASTKPSVSPDVAVQVQNHARPGAKMTKVTIIANQNRYYKLQTALENLGVTGITVTNVLGFGMQKGHTEYYRGAKVETRLLAKVQIDIVICKIPTDVLVKTVKEALYTGNVGDGKIFIYDVENVIKVRTGEEGYDALQDD